MAPLLHDILAFVHAAGMDSRPVTRRSQMINIPATYTGPHTSSAIVVAIVLGTVVGFVGIAFLIYTLIINPNIAMGPKPAQEKPSRPKPRPPPRRGPRPRLGPPKPRPTKNPTVVDEDDDDPPLPGPAPHPVRPRRSPPDSPLGPGPAGGYAHARQDSYTESEFLDEEEFVDVQDHSEVYSGSYERVQRHSGDMGSPDIQYGSGPIGAADIQYGSGPIHSPDALYNAGPLHSPEPPTVHLPRRSQKDKRRQKVPL